MDFIKKNYVTIFTLTKVKSISPNYHAARKHNYLQTPSLATFQISLSPHVQLRFSHLPEYSHP